MVATPSVRAGSVSITRSIALSCVTLCLGWLAGSPVATAQNWVEARYGMACDMACSQVSSTPISSGLHPAFGEYLVCSVDAEGEGWRAGYNLPAFAPDACITGYGGAEWFSPEGQTYLCLCR